MISDSTVAHLAGSFPSQGLSDAHAIVKHLTPKSKEGVKPPYCMWFSLGFSLACRVLSFLSSKKQQKKPLQCCLRCVWLVCMRVHACAP